MTGLETVAVGTDLVSVNVLVETVVYTVVFVDPELT